MKTAILRRKAIAFLGAAAVLFAAAAFTTGCNANAGGDSGGDIPPAEYTKVAFGTNGEGLKNYLETKASAAGINYLEVTGLSAADVNIMLTGEALLGKILNGSTLR